jgi:hypothetical protein
VLVQPAAVGVRLFGLGPHRAGLALGRWGFARHAPLAALRYARMLVARAEQAPGEARARLEEAARALEIYGADREAIALAGRIALLRGQRALAPGSTSATSRAARCVGQALASFDLARIALHEDRHEAAAGRGPGGGARAGAAAGPPALLALERPAARALLRAALDGRHRAAACRRAPP